MAWVNHSTLIGDKACPVQCAQTAPSQRRAMGHPWQVLELPANLQCRQPRSLSRQLATTDTICRIEVERQKVRRGKEMVSKLRTLQHHADGPSCPLLGTRGFPPHSPQLPLKLLAKCQFHYLGMNLAPFCLKSLVSRHARVAWLWMSAITAAPSQPWQANSCHPVAMT